MKGGKDRASDIDSGVSGHVVLPREREITRIGGAGFEFYVDGKNYDEGGRAMDVVSRRRNIEPGKWRVELQPSLQKKRVSFLVFMFPWSDAKQLDVAVDCEEHGDDTVCLIYNTEQQAKYTFNAHSNQVTITH